MHGSGRKLAMFLPDLGAGGAERIMLTLAGELADMGLALDLVVGRAEGPLAREVPAGVRLVDLKMNRMLRCIVPLARHLRRERPGAFLSALDYANVAAIMACRIAVPGIRVYVGNHIHLSSALFHSCLRERVLLSLAIRLTYKYADGVVSVSEGAADDLANIARIPRDSIRVIYNPIVNQRLLSRLSGQMPERSANAETLTILSIGRLTRQKDYGTLIRAFSRVRSQMACKLRILGEGEERASLSALIDDLGLRKDVDLPGFVADPFPAMRAAKVFALSSMWEALPTVLVEALVCQIPIVATDCPSGPREILQDGKHGRLVPVGDVEALAQGLLLALEGKIPRPGPDSWHRFDSRVSARKYLDLLNP